MDRTAHEQQDLEIALNELETFNYAVSHDLRSPLGAIINFSSILREDHEATLGKEGLSYLRRIEHNARKVADMLDDLLSYSSIGRQEMIFSRLDAGALVRRCIDQAIELGDRSRIRFEIDELPRVVADRELLELAFRQVLDNAARFTREVEHAKVEIGGRRRDGRVEYFVHDNGAGFDIEDGASLFRLFERVREKRHLEGRGIGLALVSRALQRHGGHAVVESSAGIGTTIRLSLPDRGSDHGE